MDTGVWLILWLVIAGLGQANFIEWPLPSRGYLPPLQLTAIYSV
jgi:hypothetical protein